MRNDDYLLSDICFLIKLALLSSRTACAVAISRNTGLSLSTTFALEEGYGYIRCI